MASAMNMRERVESAVRSNNMNDVKILHANLCEEVSNLPRYQNHWDKVEKKILFRNFTVEYFIPDYVKNKSMVALTYQLF